MTVRLLSEFMIISSLLQGSSFPPRTSWKYLPYLNLTFVQQRSIEKRFLYHSCSPMSAKKICTKSSAELQLMHWAKQKLFSWRTTEPLLLSKAFFLFSSSQRIMTSGQLWTSGVCMKRSWDIFHSIFCCMSSICLHPVALLSNFKVRYHPATMILNGNYVCWSSCCPEL